MEQGDSVAQMGKTMPIKIDKKIVDYGIVSQNCDDAVEDVFEADVPDCSECEYRNTEPVVAYGQHVKRPRVLPAANYKIKNPLNRANVYCGISNMGGNPFEMFLNSKDTASQEWVSAVTVLVSMALRAGIPAELIGKELKGITAVNSYFHEGRNACTVSHIGEILLQHVKDDDNELSTLVEKADGLISDAEPLPGLLPGIQCPECAGNMRAGEGCPVCIDCGYSKCS